MNLNIEFVIYASLLIALILPLYFYRQRIFSFAYKTGDLEFFLQDLKLHMKKEHPKIHFDYSIVEKTKDEKDIRTREILILEDIVNQFHTFQYTRKTQGLISKDLLWVNYAEKSKSNPKKPNDWASRRKLAWVRDEKRCNRCGTQIADYNYYTTFAKPVEKGGGYNFENLITLCNDCYRIEDSKISSTSLELYDKLMLFVKN